MALWQNVKRALKELVRSEPGAPAQPPARRPGFQLEVDGGLDIGPHGQKKLEVESEAVVAYVSRHGFQARGATCPRCVWLAARPGEWEKVHKNRHGEYVACGKCGRMLYASPNDDEGDPKPGDYPAGMPAEFFTFVRPEGWKPPKQRTTTAEPKVGDWVVIEDYTVPAIEPDDALSPPRVAQPSRCLDQEEGRILELLTVLDATKGPDRARIALGGNEGIAGAHDMGANIVTVPVGHYFVMVLPTFRKGDRVRMRQGTQEGKEGVVTSLVKPEAATLAIRLDGGLEVEVPLLHVERIITNERPH